MKIIKLTFTIFFFFLLSACATGYQPLDLDGGYSNMQLNKNLYQVNFQGNRYTSAQQVHQLLLRRCAELTKQKGYKYFVITNSNLTSKNSSYTTPSYTRQNGYIDPWGNYYGNAYSSGNQVINRTSYTESAVIRLSNTSTANAYNAKILLAQFEK